jgi:hypothetical protein
MVPRTVTTAVLALVSAVALPVLAQSAPTPLLTSLDTNYVVTKAGGFNANNIKDPGAIYVVHVDGLFSRAIYDHVTPTTTIQNGQPLPAAKGFKGVFGASGDTRQIAPGDRFYLSGIELKDDAIIFRLTSLDMHTVTQNGQSAQSRFRAALKFPLEKGAADTLTVADVHKLTDPIFSMEGAPVPTPQVQLGESQADVEKAFGQPQKVVDLGNKKILTYANLKVVLIDDKVTDAE